MSEPQWPKPRRFSARGSSADDDSAYRNRAAPRLPAPGRRQNKQRHPQAARALPPMGRKWRQDRRNRPPASAGGPAPPFQLNSREQELLEKTLAEWEKKNSSTKTFKCIFERARIRHDSQRDRSQG